MTRVQPSPQDIAAERALLGSILLDNEILSWVDVDRRCFFDLRNRAVFEAMNAANEAGMGLDVVTLEATLRRQGKLEGIGGVPFLSELVIATPTADNAKHYANLIQQKRMARETLLLASEVRGMVERDEEPEEVLAHLMRKGASIDSGRDDTVHILGDAVVREVKAIISDIERGEGPVAMLKTGIAGIDSIVGGLPRGIPSILGARPGVGKSALALALARNVGEYSGAAVITYEDREGTWAQRTLAEVTGIPVNRIRSRDLSREERGELIAAADNLKSTRSVAIVHGHGMRADRVVRKARALRNSIGAELFIVDYMQLMPNPDPRQFRKKQEAIAESLRLLGQFAGEDDVAVLVLWQLTREFAKRGTAPTDVDFGDSSAAEQQGKFIMALWEPPPPSLSTGRDDSEFDDDLELVIVKNSNGAEGKFKLPFDRPKMRIG